MNFDFIMECAAEDTGLREAYGRISLLLEEAENLYRDAPMECGKVLRSVAEEICRMYNRYYQIGFEEETSLEQFLCYTDKEAHNAMVSRFLSVVRREQRDRLIKLRVLGDDCILGAAGDSQGMSLEDRMSKNARQMMEAMMDVLKDMCEKIDGREDLTSLRFDERALPVKEEALTSPEAEQEEKAVKAGEHFFAGIFKRKKK